MVARPFVFILKRSEDVCQLKKNEFISFHEFSSTSFSRQSRSRARALRYLEDGLGNTYEPPISELWNYDH